MDWIHTDFAISMHDIEELDAILAVPEPEPDPWPEWADLVLAIDFFYKYQKDYFPNQPPREGHEACIPN